LKIRRFVAADMKTALAQIKEELGADAVIMSNKKIVEGVEIMAAVDYYPSQTAEQSTQAQSSDSVGSQSIGSQSTRPQVTSSQVSGSENLRQDKVSITHTAQPTSQAPIQNTEEVEQPVDSLSALLNRKVQNEAQANTATINNASNPEPSSNSDIELQFKNFTDRLQETTQNRNAEQSIEQQKSEFANTHDPASSGSVGSNNQHSPDNNNVPTNHIATTANNSASFSPENSAEFAHMKKEMHTIRHLLEHQLSGLMWQDMAQKNPQKALLINKLVALGLTDHMADQIAGFIPPQHNEQDAWEEAKKFIAQQLNTTNNDIIHHGGVISLVGPTGVGKTTTIAKLAARFAQIHGADEVVLISTDSFRIGGFEQLTTYGRIIGCQVKLANDAEALDALLQQYGQKKLILIDTAGMGQRDMRLAEHLTSLIANARVRIRNYLVLSANTQQRVMQENVERFKKIPLAGCIYTKLDESISIGEIISTSIQNGLPIGYLTDGQRVPEDIKVANAEKLVALADKMSGRINHQQSSSWRPMPNKQANAA